MVLTVGKNYIVSDQRIARSCESPRFVSIISDRGADKKCRFVGNDGHCYTENGQYFIEKESPFDLIEEVNQTNVID